MSTNAAKPPVGATTQNLDETLERRIDETRRLVLRVDLWLSVIVLVTILFGGLLLAILADHWLFKDGLSGTMRFGIFGGLALLAGLYIYRRIVPLFLYPINPVYAASVLEQSAPTLKNALLNWILLRQEREERGASQDRLTERMYDGVARSAASGVAAVPSERAVDLRGVGRWSIILAILFLFFVVYCILSPKSPFTSLARIILPMSGIDRPQAVRFLDIQPGNAVFQQGEKTTVSVEIVSNSLNLGNEPVYLFFSTDDGQAVRQAIPMNKPEGKARFEAPFPPGKQGFVSGVEYWIGQGESRSGAFRIEVRPTASIEVASLTYQYPAYTGKEDETVENSGDIRAVEGTEVRIRARSTLPLERMDLLFEGNAALSTPMRIMKDKPNEAVTSLILERDAKDESTPTIRNFTFRAVDQDGFESRRSGMFRMEILPDRAPRIQWGESPRNLNDLAELEIPVNGSLELPIQAEDPDFALRYVRFHVDTPNRATRPVELLNSGATGPTPHSGVVNVKTVFKPKDYRLTEGDSVDVWAEAVDSKYPDANTATTRRIKITLGKQQEQDANQPQQEQQSQEEQPKDDNKGDKDQENQRDEKQKDDQKQEDSEGDGDSNEGSKAGENKTDQDKAGSGEDSANDQSQGGDSDENKHDNAANENAANDGNEASKDPSGDQQNPSDGGDGQKQSDQREQGKNQEQNQQNGGNEQKGQNGQQDRVDPETQSGDAMDRIMEQMRRENKLPSDEELKKQAERQQQEQQNQEQNDDKQQDAQQPGGGEQPGNQQEQNAGDKRQNAQQPGGGEQPGDQQEQNAGDKQQNAQQPGGDEQPGNQQEQNAGDGQDSQQPQDGGGGQKDNQQPGNAQQASDEGGENAQQPSGDARQDGPQQGTDATDGQQNGAGNQGNEQNAGDKDGGDAQQTGGKQPGGNQGGQETDGDASDGPKDGAGSEKSPGKDQHGDAPAGGERSGDPDSNPASKTGNNQNSDGENLPVNPSDKKPRERSDDLDPNSSDRRQQGTHGDDPQHQQDQQDKTDFQHASKSGDGEGKGEETKQTGQSDTLQKSDKGERSESGTDGEEQDGGTEGEGESKSGAGQERESQNGPNQKPGQQGDQPGQQNQPGQPSDQPGQQSNQPGQQNQPGQPSNQPGNPGQSGQMSEGTGAPGAGGAGGQGIANTDTARENPNEKYSEQVTNLVLEYLEDQLKEKPSEDLLKELGWNEQELRDWHRKWKSMSDQGQKAREGTQENEQWKESLRSLGIKPDRQDTRRSRGHSKDVDAATEVQRFAPPPGLENRAKTYSEQIAK